MRSMIAAWFSSVTFSVRDHAHRRAGDLDLLARHERGRVVEDGTDVVGVLGVVVGRLPDEADAIQGAMATSSAM